MGAGHLLTTEREKERDRDRKKESVREEREGGSQKGKVKMA